MAGKLTPPPGHVAPNERTGPEHDVAREMVPRAAEPVAVDSFAFERAFEEMITDPAARKRAFGKETPEERRGRMQAYFAEQAKTGEASQPAPAATRESKLARASDEELAAAEAALSEERERRYQAEYLAAGGEARSEMQAENAQLIGELDYGEQFGQTWGDAA